MSQPYQRNTFGGGNQNYGPRNYDRQGGGGGGNSYYNRNQQTTTGGDNQESKQNQDGLPNNSNYRGGQNGNQGGNTGGIQSSFNKQDQPNQGYIKKQDGDFKPRKQVLSVITEVALNENFSESYVFLASQIQQQQQFIGNQGQQGGASDRLQIALCNENIFQIHVVEKSNQTMKLLSSDCIASQNQIIKLDKCFPLKNISNDGLDMTVFTLKNTQTNLYGFSVIKTDPQQPNSLKEILHTLTAHSDAITNVIAFNNYIVTVSDDKDQCFVKFWQLQNNNIVLVEEMTNNFNETLSQSMKGVNLELSPIQCIDFLTKNKTFVIISFQGFSNFNISIQISFCQNNQYDNILIHRSFLIQPQTIFQSIQQRKNQQDNGKQYPQQNCLFLFEFNLQNAPKEVGPQTASITSIKIIMNEVAQNGSMNIFAQLSNFTIRDVNSDIKQRKYLNIILSYCLTYFIFQLYQQKARGFFYVIKNFSEKEEIYSSDFPLSDFTIAKGKNTATLVIATRNRIIPFTWDMQNEKFKQHQYDSSITMEGGNRIQKDIQNIHLFKNIANLVEINQMLIVHYPKEKSLNNKKCITLASLQLVDNVERTDKPEYKNNQFSNPQQPQNNQQQTQQRPYVFKPFYKPFNKY